VPALGTGTRAKSAAEATRDERLVLIHFEWRDGDVLPALICIVLVGEPNA
jgi:hypothetical protein